MEDLLFLEHVVKSFPGHNGLKDGQLRVRPGEIHALIGANGAGKSTFMKVLYGIYTPDSGTMLLNGQPFCFKSIAEAQAAGVFMVPQELQIVKDLTVAQNIFLGRERMKGLSVDDKAMISESREILKAVGLRIDPAAPMCLLSPAEQQLTQIAALLTRNPKLIILDEPTTALGSDDVERLFALMKSFKEKGISIIFISHRLDELFAISDRITVMRNGRFIVSEEVSKITKEELVCHMTGRSVRLNEKEKSAVPEDAETVLEVRGLSTEDYLHDVSFRLKKGEILGFTGLMGSGRTEMARAVCGLDPVSGGKILLNGKEVVIRTPVDAMKYGIGYLSEERNEEGLIHGKDVIFNTAVSSLDRYRKGLQLNDKAITEDALRYNQQVHTVTSDFFGAVENLSGGNRQKVLIARALMKDLQILILDEPTRGIDVGAKEEIYEIIKQLAADGHSAIVISSEYEEIRVLCDRVMIMYEGTTVGELAAGELTNESIMNYATGLKGKTENDR